MPGSDHETCACKRVAGGVELACRVRPSRGAADLAAAQHSVPDSPSRALAIACHERGSSPSAAARMFDCLPADAQQKPAPLSGATGAGDLRFERRASRQTPCMPAAPISHPPTQPWAAPIGRPRSASQRTMQEACCITFAGRPASRLNRNACRRRPRQRDGPAQFSCCCSPLALVCPAPPPDQAPTQLAELLPWQAHRLRAQSRGQRWACAPPPAAI